MSTPIPRTSSAIIASGFQAVPEGFRAFAGILERELTALTTERDELRAQLHALALVCGTTDADKFQTWVDRANARAERAEAELASERGRLDYLSTRGFEHRHHETGDHLGYEWTISSYSESEDVTLRDVIDAEMREDEK